MAREVIVTCTGGRNPRQVSIVVEEAYDAYERMSIMYGGVKAGRAEYDGCEFVDLHVFDRFRKLGIGKAVARRVMARMAEKNGCTMITGTAVPDSIGFLEKAGFVIGEKDGGYYNISAEATPEKSCKDGRV